MEYGLSNGHVTNDVTWPWNVKLVTPIRLECNISKTTWARETSNLIHGFVWAMQSRRTNNFPWKWAWPRSRDPYNFGSTVGYPSGSLASWFDCCLYANICWITCTCKFQSRMHESTGLGMGMGMCFVGMGWGWKKIHGNGVGMGLIFNTVSLFTVNSNDLHRSSVFYASRDVQDLEYTTPGSQGQDQPSEHVPSLPAWAQPSTCLRCQSTDHTHRHSTETPETTHRHLSETSAHRPHTDYTQTLQTTHTDICL